VEVAGLGRCGVEHDVDAGKGLGQTIGGPQIERRELDVGWEVRDGRRTVDGADRVAATEQGRDDLTAEEPGGSGDEHPHGVTPVGASLLGMVATRSSTRSPVRRRSPV
jgi:hypothetical protein